jgi:hypothetical protein
MAGMKCLQPEPFSGIGASGERGGGSTTNGSGEFPAGLFLAGLVWLYVSGYCAYRLVYEQGFSGGWFYAVVALTVPLPVMLGFRSLVGGQLERRPSRSFPMPRLTLMHAGLFSLAIAFAAAAVGMGELYERSSQAAIDALVAKGAARSELRGLVQPVGVYLRLMMAGILIQLAIITASLLKANRSSR